MLDAGRNGFVPDPRSENETAETASLALAPGCGLAFNPDHGTLQLGADSFRRRATHKDEAAD